MKFYARLCLFLCIGVLGIASLEACSKKQIQVGARGYQQVSGVTGKGSAVCRSVRSQLGVRYKYGAASPRDGFDCSGLLYWAFKQHGVHVPRTAKAQAAAGRWIQKSKLAPGDIVVFKISSGYHTGLYVGNGKFIHSPKAGDRVREESMSVAYWSKRYHTGRRVL